MTKAHLGQAHELGPVFAHLTNDGQCLAVEVNQDFWTQGVERLPPGRLISLIESHSDWTNWEMHPAGDELVLQMSGVMTVIFDDSANMPPCKLSPGQFVIIPSGVWHTADVSEPGKAMFITPGEDTQSRAR